MLRCTDEGEREKHQQKHQLLTARPGQTLEIDASWELAIEQASGALQKYPPCPLFPYCIK
jgi:hypothetical protein